MHAEDDPRLLERPEDAVHGAGRGTARHAREDVVRVLAARIDRSDERHAEVQPRDPLELLAGVRDVLQREPAGGEEAVGRGAAEVLRPVVVGAGERIRRVDVLDEGVVHHEHRRDDHHLVDAHEVHLFEACLRIVRAGVLEVPLLLGRERCLLELPHDLLAHLWAGDADRVVARELVVATADRGRAAVQQGLPLVLPVCGADEVAVLRRDVRRPDLVRVVDVRVAVEDGEGLGDASVGGAHWAPPWGRTP